MDGKQAKVVSILPNHPHILPACAHYRSANLPEIGDTPTQINANTLPTKLTTDSGSVAS